MSDFLQGTLIAVGGIAAVLFLMAIVGLIVAWPISLIWNWLMPAVFGLSVITYWQGFWMFFLANLLLKGGSVSSE